MITQDQAREIIGGTAYTRDGDKLGKVGQLYLDDQTGEPAFVTVNTGLFGTKESFVPVAEADWSGDRLTVPYTKDTIKDAPNVDLDGGHLDQAEESRLYQHYGMGGGYSTSGVGTDQTTDIDRSVDPASSGTVTSGTADTTGTTGTTDTTGTAETAGAGIGRGTEGYDTSGPTTDEAMTRSEEHLQVGTTEQEAGRARLRKYVTTETETATVPVRKERAVVETEPITDANVGEALDGPEISEEEHEVVLHEERPVVSTETTPVERVRLGKETVADQETVTGEVREEHIEVDGDVDRR